MGRVSRQWVGVVAMLGCAAWAGTRQLKNDAFTGAGGVNSSISFAEYEGAGVLFTPDAGDYPLKVIAIDVLAVNYGTGSGTSVGAYQIDLWDETGGSVTPPKLFDGGTYHSVLNASGLQLTTSTSMFNRFDLPQPLFVDAGQLFVGISEQLDTATDGTTIGLDLSTQIPGANWFFDGAGTFERIDLPDGGKVRGITRNWIVRLVLEVADAPVTVSSIAPNAGPSNVTTPVVIVGTNFEFGARAFVGTNELALTGVNTTTINATVPAGINPGRYDVRVRNLNGVEGTLAQVYSVLFADGGSPDAGFDAGSGGGAGGGGGGGGSGGGSGGGAGGGTVALALDSITPAEGYSADTTRVVVTGSGFATGAQLFIGTTLIDGVEVKSSSVLNATIPSGLATGSFDVVVVALSIHTRGGSEPLAFRRSL